MIQKTCLQFWALVKISLLILVTSLTLEHGPSRRLQFAALMFNLGYALLCRSCNFGGAYLWTSPGVEFVLHSSSHLVLDILMSIKMCYA
jgi:hypothetical protein